MDDTNNKVIEELFRKANAELSGPSPYLKTRVLARVREKKSRTRVLSWFAALATVSTMVVAAMVFKMPSSDFNAKSGAPVLVKVELQNLKASNIAFAEIVLPEGVHFYSGKFPEVKDSRTLMLAWDSSFEKGKLPFVVESDVAGKQDIKIRLLGEDHKVLGEKIVKINFKG